MAIALLLGRNLVDSVGLGPDPADKAKRVAEKAKQSDGLSSTSQFSHVEIEVATAKSALSWIGFSTTSVRHDALYLGLMRIGTKYWKFERAKKRELSTKAFRKVFSQMVRSPCSVIDQWRC